MTTQGKKRNNWKEEASKVRDLALLGRTLQDIGDIYGVTREMIRQVLLKHYPEIGKTERGCSVTTKVKRSLALESLYARTGRYTGHHETDLSRAISQAFIRKRQNSRYSKWGWDIKKEDITYSMVCPYLGITLDWFAEYRADNSPSFDRIDPTKGYVKGNVIICSWRANRIKNDGTIEEHRQIADSLEKLQKDLTRTM